MINGVTQYFRKHIIPYLHSLIACIYKWKYIGKENAVLPLGDAFYVIAKLPAGKRKRIPARSVSVADDMGIFDLGFNVSLDACNRYAVLIRDQCDKLFFIRIDLPKYMIFYLLSLGFRERHRIDSPLYVN